MKTDEFTLIKPGEVRTRFAPSPTGKLHIGGSRTALFNYLFAKKHKGVFILRIEDTDIERSRPEYEKDILESLRWLGLDWDEGIAEPEGQKLSFANDKYIGKYGPYRQRERLALYKKHLQKLLDEDKAYYCFCPKEELEAQKQYKMSIGEPPIYSGKCARLANGEVKKKLAENRESVIRFRTPGKKITFKDLIRGEIEFDSSLIGDFVIAKDLSMPLYNFAAVVDDFEMKISHVIRGEEHISNTPRQILIQEALSFSRPLYAHLPLLLGEDRSKLSKRHGAASTLEYKKDGYLPEAVINFIAFLGWNPGTDREIYSLNSLIKDFSLEKIQKGGAIFNIKKLDYLNGFYIRQCSIGRLTEFCLPYLIAAGLIAPLEISAEKINTFKIVETGEIIGVDYIKKTVSVYQKRLKKLSEITGFNDFFFKNKLSYDKELLRWKTMTDAEIEASLDRLEKFLSPIKPGDWEKEKIEKPILAEAETFAAKIGKAGLPTDSAFAATSAKEAALAKTGDRGYLMWPFRVALSGKKYSAGPIDIAAISGKEKTLKRIKDAKNVLR